MLYHSTRNQAEKATAIEAILRGIAPDGGLYVPDRIPAVDFYPWMQWDYKTMCKSVFELFFTDFTKREVSEMVDAAYDGKFDTSELVETKWIGDVGFLELYHGPTLAFKDMALSALPQLMTVAAKKASAAKGILILVATSGDTGKAAMEGFSDVEGVEVVVFYPDGGVSPVQLRQMLTQKGANVHAVALTGNFDDAQTGVKEMFMDLGFIEALNSQNVELSSANSINIGRLIPQIVYYIYAYRDAVKNGKVDFGEKIDVVVPTGNFGNILAAAYAKEMGLPIDRLICAANDNHVLADFFETGVYDRRRELVLTSSPSMDILISSNLERYLYLQNPNSDEICGRMEALKETGQFEVPLSELDVVSGWANEQEVSEAIRALFSGSTSYLVDPHTAVGYAVLEKVGVDRPTVIASTASPYKFAEKVLASIADKTQAYEDEQALASKLSEVSGTDVPKQLVQVWETTPKREVVVSKAEMRDAVLHRQDL